MASLSTENVQDSADSAKKMMTKTVGSTLEQGRSIAKDRIETLKGQSADLMKYTEKSIRKNPILALGIAVGVGAVLMHAVNLSYRAARS